MHVRRRRVIEHLITRGILTEAHLAHSDAAVHALSQHFGVPAFDVRTHSVDPALWSLVSFDLAEKHLLVPLAQHGTTLIVAVADPSNLFAIDDVKFLTGFNIEVVVADADDLLAVLDAQRELARGCVMRPQISLGQLDALEMTFPIANLVNLILVDAMKKGATEIVIEPRANDLTVWFAVGAQLEEAMKPPRKLLRAMVTCLRTKAREQGWFSINDLVDVDARFFTTRFGTQVSLRLFSPKPSHLDELALTLPAFADAARIEPGPADGQGRVDLHTAKGWRPTWTYPMSRHTALVAAAREVANVDVTDDECANGVRLFLRKRS